MAFRQADSEGRGGFAKVWKVANKGNYSDVQLSTSKKSTTDPSGYENDFSHNFVRFVGSAHTKVNEMNIGKGGATIQITSCEVGNKYDSGKNVTYTNFVVYDFVIPESSTANNNANKTQISSAAAPKKTTTKVSAPVDDTDDSDELPF